MDILLLYIDINVYPRVERQINGSDLFFVIEDSILSNYWGFFQVFPAYCRSNTPGVIPGRKQESWSQHGRVCPRVMFYSLHGAFHFGMH